LAGRGRAGAAGRFDPLAGRATAAALARGAGWRRRDFALPHEGGEVGEMFHDFADPGDNQRDQRRRQPPAIAEPREQRG
jgi:hypothetical protein